MAKPKSSSYNVAPWIMGRKEFEKFIPITDINRKNAIIQGRIIYRISVVGNIITFCGHKVIDPCFTKGRWKIDHLPFTKNVSSPTFEVYIFDEMNRGEWASFWEKTLRKGIEKKELFINPNDPIIQYYKL